MVLIYVASFNRASDGAISKLVERMKEEKMYTDRVCEADYILAVGDREETYDFVLDMYKQNKKIIHLWAGEKSNFEVHDDVYRHSMTLMSDIQLCTNKEASNRVKELCKSVGKMYKIFVVGNVMLDNLEIDESNIPEYIYDLVLYNPITRRGTDEVSKELEEINKLITNEVIWIEPNGDKYSDLVEAYVNTSTLPRPIFLGLLKNCNKFITNSSCQYYEAQFLLDKKKIVPIGERNTNRESKSADMSITGATEKIIKVFRLL